MRPSYKRRRQVLTQLRKDYEPAAFKRDDRIPLSPRRHVPVEVSVPAVVDIPVATQIRDQFVDAISGTLLTEHGVKLVPLSSRGHGKTFAMQQIYGQAHGVSSVKIGDMLTLDDREYRVLKSDAGIVCTREWESARTIDPDWKPKLIGATQEHRRKLRKHWFYTLEWDDDAEQLKELGLRVAMVKGHPGLIHEGDWHFVETLREIRGKRDLDGWARRVSQGDGPGIWRSVPVQQPNIANWPRSVGGSIVQGVSWSEIIVDELKEFREERDDDPKQTRS